MTEHTPYGVQDELITYSKWYCTSVPYCKYQQIRGLDNTAKLAGGAGKKVPARGERDTNEIH